MAENNSSAPLKTAEGAATLWCVHVTGADDVHPMPSREVALEEANALNTSICRIKRQDIDPVLIAVVAEWPHYADSHAAGLMIRDECLRMRGDQAVAAQAAPAAVAVPDDREAYIDWLSGSHPRVFSRKDAEAYWRNEHVSALAWQARAALAALPATEDSSAGDLADWAIDVSTGREILVYKNCSVIEAEQARIVLSLVKQAEVQAEPVAWADWRVGSKSYDLHRTREQAEASVRQSELAAPQEGPYEVVPLYTAPQAQPADALDALTEIIGCIEAANSEGLDDALVNNTDARLADLVQRRLLPAFYTAIATQARAAMAAAQEGGIAAKEA